MAKLKPFLSLDVGAGSVKMAEYLVTEEGTLYLQQYGVKSLGQEGSQESKREEALSRAIQELIAERGFTAREANLCAPNFQVFSKFVKLPPVDTSKVTQIIQYEAQQNVPFPLEEVVWDYQITGTSPGGELEVLLVAIKADTVEGIFRTSEIAGLRLQLVDVSPAALANAFRFNYGDVEGCTMLLNIGAKNSTVLLFEKGKFYARSINIGANSITQDFATEAKLRFPEAERIKIEEGFVSLGGAYAEPESQYQQQISKIARQVMTRLHIQVNQTIQFYRGQQGGSAPQRLLLSGGASVMPYTAEFFAEKLGVEVDYFNPLRNLEIDPNVEVEELAQVAHSLGEVVGLGLRNLAQCPVEVNLMPKSSLQKQQLKRKQPYFIATFFSLVLVVLAVGWFFSQIAGAKQAAYNEIDENVRPLESAKRDLSSHLSEIREAEDEMSQLLGYLDGRVFWTELLTEFKNVFYQTENQFSSEIDAGVWIENLKAGRKLEGVAVQQTTAGSSGESSEDSRRQEMMERYGRPAGGSSQQATASTESTTNTNQVSKIELDCRAVNLNRLRPDANAQLAYSLEKGLKESSLFDEKGTKLKKMQSVSESDLTFTLKLVVKLKRPIEL